MQGKNELACKACRWLPLKQSWSRLIKIMLHQVQAWTSIGRACKLRHMLAVLIIYLPHWHMNPQIWLQRNFLCAGRLLYTQGVWHFLQSCFFILILDVLDAAARFAVWLHPYHLKPRRGPFTKHKLYWLLCIVLAID